MFTDWIVFGLANSILGPYIGLEVLRLNNPSVLGLTIVPQSAYKILKYLMSMLTRI